MPTYEFVCNGHTFTARAGFDEREKQCACGRRAARAAVNRINFGGFARTPAGERDYSRDFKNSQEAGAELEYQHERLRDATQIADLKPPPLYQMAKAKARELQRKGATADDL